jgi:2-(1,2-epoxy-1,2-dihydrophenyl)acetyl-CoA isomerase
MSYETLLYEIDGNVAWITFNRPDDFNAMNLQMTKELLDAANRCGSDPAVRAVVITGSGDQSYCAGGDIQAFVDAGDDVDMVIKEMTTHLHMAVSRFAWLNAPVIAAVNGVAAGAGLSMMAFGDLAIASDKAKFVSAYTKIGLTPDGSSSYFLTRILGTRRAAELYLTNRTLDAQEALDWGLVNRVVPHADVKAEAGKLAAELADGPTRAYAGVKTLLMTAPNDTLESQMERETRLIVERAGTADAREGLSAFIDKRKPNFVGA